MAGITLAQAEAHLAAALASMLAVTEKGQVFDVNGRTLTRVNMSHLQENVKYWDMMVKRLSGGRRGGPSVSYGAFG